MFPRYVTEATNAGWQPVSVVDRNPIQEYLKGTKDEEQIPAIVKMTEAPASVVDRSKGLSDVIGADKLAELKRQVKQTRGDGDVVASAVYRADAGFKDIQARERLYLDRKTVLQAPTKDFSKLLTRLEEIKNGGKKAKEQQTNGHSKQPAPAAVAARAAAASSSSKSARAGYDRFEQSEDRVMKASGIELEMSINTRGTFGVDDPTNLASFASRSSQPLLPAAPQAAARNNKRSYEQISANEPTDMDIDYDNPTGPSSSSSAPPAAASSAQSKRTASATASASAKSAAEPPAKKAKTRYHENSLDPIILVPAASDAKTMLNVTNVEKFLKDNQYEPPVTTGPRVRSRTLERPRKDGSGKTVQYTFVDGSRLTPAEIDRVVCVVSNGTSWQFKCFPEDLRQPAILFSRVKGFFLRYEDEPAPQEVRSWNVAQLTVSKPRRHLDQAASIRFWEELEQFIQTSRPEIKQ